MSELLVCGGREYTERVFLFEKLDEFHERCPVSHLIHGGARGADTLAHQWALSREIPRITVHPAQWGRHGKRAGPIRNMAMLNSHPGVAVMAFPGGKGTQHMINLAVGYGLSLHDYRE
jgi:hypothetical protein